MAYVRQRRQKDGTVRFYARYLGADGRYHEEGGFGSKREADKIGRHREVDAARGTGPPPPRGASPSLTTSPPTTGPPPPTSK